MARSRRRAARARRRPAVDVDALVERALQIVDAEGLEAVTMRRLAAEFDTGPATLYSHVSGKDELYGLIAQRLYQEVEVPDSGPWQDVVRGWCHSQREVFRRHNDAAILCFGVLDGGEAMAQGAERLLRAMITGGVPAQVAAWAIDALTLYVTADVYEAWLVERRIDDGSGRPAGERIMEHFEGMAGMFAALPADRYPFVTAHVRELMHGGGDERFAFGLETFIAGIAASAGTDGAGH